MTDKLMPWTKNLILEYLDFPVQRKQMKTWEPCYNCGEEATPADAKYYGGRKTIYNSCGTEDICYICSNVICENCELIVPHHTKRRDAVEPKWACHPCMKIFLENIPENSPFSMRWRNVHGKKW